jgi:CarD family transcriptional regulator
MQFSVGDKVVHPRYGPGAIASIERKELMDGPKHYYVIEMAGPRLTVQIPVSRADEVGLRLAMTQSRLPQVLIILQRRPHLLPKDYKQRQARIGDQLRTGRASQLARAVRDLTWHRKLAYLTKTDTDNLRQGSDLLAAEMAMVSGDAVSDTSKLIAATMVAAMASVVD